jgi:hypothetical protein
VTRIALMAGAVLLSLAVSLHLLRQTRYAARSHEPVAQTLARYAADAPGVVIVFQPKDCLGDGTIVHRWNSLSAAPGFNVRGLLVGEAEGSPAHARVRAITSVGISLGTISTMDAGLLAEKLGYASTPFAMVLVTAGWRVRFPLARTSRRPLLRTWYPGTDHGMRRRRHTPPVRAAPPTRLAVRPALRRADQSPPGLPPWPITAAALFLCGCGRISPAGTPATPRIPPRA